MNKRQTHQVLEVLVAAFPKAPKLEPETVMLYAMQLARFDLDVAMLAAQRIAETCETFPTISTLLAHCQAQVRRLDTYNRPRQLSTSREQRDAIGLEGVRRARAAMAGAADRCPDVSFDADRPKPGEFNAAGPHGEPEPEPIAS